MTIPSEFYHSTCLCFIAVADFSAFCSLITFGLRVSVSKFYSFIMDELARLVELGALPFSEPFDPEKPNKVEVEIEKPKMRIEGRLKHNEHNLPSAEYPLKFNWYCLFVGIAYAMRPIEEKRFQVTVFLINLFTVGIY